MRILKWILLVQVVVGPKRDRKVHISAEVGTETDRKNERGSGKSLSRKKGEGLKSEHTGVVFSGKKNTKVVPVENAESGANKHARKLGKGDDWAFSDLDGRNAPRGLPRKSKNPRKAKKYIEDDDKSVETASTDSRSSDGDVRTVDEVEEGCEPIEKSGITVTPCKNSVSVEGASCGMKIFEPNIQNIGKKLIKWATGKTDSSSVSLNCLSSVKERRGRGFSTAANTPAVEVNNPKEGETTVFCLDSKLRTVFSYTDRTTSPLMKEILVGDETTLWDNAFTSVEPTDDTQHEFIVKYAKRVCAWLEKMAAQGSSILAFN